MTTVSAIAEGIDNTGVVKLFDQHTCVRCSYSEAPSTTQLLRYQYSTCDPVRNARATLPALVNHQNITVSLLNTQAMSSYN